MFDLHSSANCAPRTPFALINLYEIDRLNTLPSSSIRVYLSIATHANSEGTCWPGRERLGTMTGLNPEQVSKATYILSLAGLIEKSYTDTGRVIYRLPYHQAALSESTPPRVNSDTPPCQNRHPEPTSEPTARTEREQAPEPARVEPQEPAPLSTRQLRSIKTPPPDEVPDQWLVIGKELRTDLDEALIRASAEKFLDDRRSKAIVLVDWIPAWKNWIRNERTPKAPTSASKASKPETGPQPYATWKPGEKAPIGAAVDEDAAIKDFEAQAMKLGMVKGADGVWYRPTSPVIVKPVAPAKNEPYTPAIPAIPATFPKVPAAESQESQESHPSQSENPPLSRRQQLERDFAVIGEAIARGATADELKALEKELKARREVALGGREG